MVTRLRGVRARLVVAYLLITALAATAGVVVFALLLSGTLEQNADSSLRATAGSFAAEIRSGGFDEAGTAPTVATMPARGDVLNVVAVYAPGGRLVDAEPLVLPADPRAVAVRDGLQTVRYDGRPFRMVRVAVPVVSGRWIVVVGQSIASTNDATSDALRVLYVIVPIAVVLSGAGAWWLSGAALRPVERMRRDAQRLSVTGRPGSISVPATTDSLNRLARTFNELLQRMQDSLQRQRDFVADAGHELRTPLAVLQTELETAVRPGRTRADLEDSIKHARGETARLASLAEDLLLLAQADGPERVVQPELVEPSAVVAACVTAHHAEFQSAAVELVGPRTDGMPAAVAEIDPVALRRVLDNLLANALRHAPTGGTVTVSAQTSDTQVTFVVRDDGPGFPADFLPHAFTRFSRAERSRSRSSAAAGSGLGLSIVATLVEAHGGSVTAENVQPTGARITVRFPSSSPPQP